MDVAMKLEFDSDDCDDGEHEINSSMDTNNSRVDENEEKEITDNNIDLQENRCSLSSPEDENLFCVRSRSSRLFSSCSHSPPYKRIRALRLFDSPATPKTLLQKCAADSTSALTGITQSCSYPATRSRVFCCKSGCASSEQCRVCTPLPSSSKTNSSSCNKSGKPSANINPFTPTGMLLSRKRTRSKRDLTSDSAQQSDVSFASDIHASETEISLAGCTSVIAADETEDDYDELLSPSKRLSLHEANVSRYHEEFVEMSLIGQGEFGGVYKCRHRLDGCIYAIKKSLKPVAGSANERIALNEVYAHAVLGKHPHVVRYYSAWAENNHMIIQNEYCNGGSLAEFIEKRKQVGEMFLESELKQLLLHIAKGLRYIHSQQLVHMDIKPGNIFIAREQKLPMHGEESADDGFEEEEEEDQDIIYKIGDLGHVTSVVNPQVEEGDCRYLPREILQEDFLHLSKADIFAVGLTIYEVATAKPLPLNGADWHAIRDGNFDDIPHLSYEFKFLLKLMMHPDPRERPTASQLVQQLSCCHSGNKSHAQLRRELNAERFKNEILSRKLEEASKCLKTLGPNLATSPLKLGITVGLASNLRSSRKAATDKALCNVRSGSRKSRSRLVGKMATRSSSTTNF